MEQIANFLDMGGYAVFVWSSYGVTALVMVGLTITSLRGLRERQRLLQRLEAARPDRRRADRQRRGTPR